MQSVPLHLSNGIEDGANSADLRRTIATLQRQLELKTSALKRERLRNQQLEQEIELTVQERTSVLQQAQMALQASEERLRIALEAADAGVWDVDLVTGQQTWSPQTYSLFGYCAETDQASQAAFWQRIHPDDRAIVQQAYRQALQTGIYQVEFRLLLPNQPMRWLSSRGRIFFAEGQPVRMTGVDIDISARKQIEEQLQASLQEKEVLLKEIHHRVKNNLQIISSLMRMQSRRCTDAETIKLLLESQNRVQAMALIHEQLYQASDLSQISFADYIRLLVEALFQSYGISPTKIQLRLEVQEVCFSLNRTILCGLIVNELVSNALKYAFPDSAFPDSKQREITIYLSESKSGTSKFGTGKPATSKSATSKTVSLRVQDNGIGISPALDWQATRSLGLRIVRTLVAQLKGEIQLDCTSGTAFCIHFPAL